MIRLAVPADAAELARVFVAAWRQGYRGVVAADVLDALDAEEWAGIFAGHLRTGDLTSIVWDEGAGCPLGFAMFGADPDTVSPSDGYLASLYVDPAASGRGIGTALLAAVLESLAECGRGNVSLWVFTENKRARMLYERAGFTDTAEVITDPRWQATQMRYRRIAG
jgi:ribosomal protein S18 acetylase RimI-like enzyme